MREHTQKMKLIGWIVLGSLFLLSCKKGPPAELLQAEQEISKKNYLVASNLLRQALQKAPTHESILQKLDLCFQEIEKKSLELVAEKKWDEARQYLETIFLYTEKDPIFFLNYATCLLSKPPAIDTEHYKDQDLAIRSFTTYYAVLGQEHFAQEPVIDSFMQQLDPQLQEKPYSTSLIYSTRYTNQDLEYLAESYMYQQMAMNIAQSAKTEREKVFAVFEWLLHQVVSNVPAGKTEFAIKPKGVAFRGFGVSERSGHLFITLLHQLHIPAQLVMLRKKENDSFTPISALVRVYFENQWYLFDPLAGVPLLKPNGELLSYAEIEQNPAIIGQIRYGAHPYLFSEHHFQHAKIYMVVRPRSFFPKMRELQKCLDLVNGPNVFFDLRKELEQSGISEEVWNKQEHKNLVPWAFPFELLLQYKDAKYVEERDLAMKDIYSFFQARILQVLGQNASAEVFYEQFLKVKDFQPSEDFFYFRALNIAELGKKEEAITWLSEYLQKYPQALWKSAAHFHLGLCLLPNQPEESKKHFQAVSAPFTLHLAWKYPQLFQ